MTRKSGTSRRAFSIRGITYERLHEWSKQNGGVKVASISGFVENLIEEKLGPPTPEDFKKLDEETQKRIEDKERKKALAGSLDMDGYVPPILLL
jgi:hypothetical protein